MADYKITKETNILDGYTRYFFYINGNLIKGADTEEQINEIARKVKDNNGTLIAVETLKEFTC